MKFSDSVFPQQFELNFPQLNPGELVQFNDIIFNAYKPDIGNSVVGVIEDYEGNVISRISVDYFPLALNLNLVNNPIPGETFPKYIDVKLF